MFSSRAALVVTCTLLGVFPLAAHAQYGLLGSPALLIVTTPAHPSPGQTVQLSVQSPMADLDRSLIAWSVDGKPLSEGPGVTSVAVVAGKLGSELSVRVVAQTDQGVMTATAAIIPAEVDLLYDANSYVPPFYEGRALPSPSSQLRLQAVARVVHPDKGTVAPSDLIYTWMRNGATLTKQSGKGRATVVVPAPSLFGTDTITVEAATADGVAAGGASLRVPSIEPVLVFYEDSPLFGIRYRNALRATDTFAGGELTIAAVPYFALATGPTDQRLEYAWQVNGSAVPPDTERPDEITVSTGGGGGVADITLQITNDADLSMETSGSLHLTFSRGASSAGTRDGAEQNPFRGQ